MKYNPVGWFELPVNDTNRAQKFYQELLGITLNRQDIPDYEMLWFPSEENSYGSPGALMKGMGYKPSKGGVIIYFTCPHIDEALERVEKIGGKIFLPKKDIGEYGYIAWVEDTEGNVIGLHRRK